jgi:hypothetical protein
MKIRKVLLGAVEVACGILALALLRWTPTTGKGILAYAILFAILIALAIGFSGVAHAGYWQEA